MRWSRDGPRLRWHGDGRGRACGGRLCRAFGLETPTLKLGLFIVLISSGIATSAFNELNATTVGVALQMGAVVAEAYKLWLQYDVRTDDITMITIYLEEMSGLAAAHDAELAALKTESTKSDNNSSKKNETLRELRRKSSVTAPPRRSSARSGYRLVPLCPSVRSDQLL